MNMVSVSETFQITAWPRGKVLSKRALNDSTEASSRWKVLHYTDETRMVA